MGLLVQADEPQDWLTPGRVGVPCDPSGGRRPVGLALDAEVLDPRSFHNPVNDGIDGI